MSSTSSKNKSWNPFRGGSGSKTQKASKQASSTTKTKPNPAKLQSHRHKNSEDEKEDKESKTSQRTEGWRSFMSRITATRASIRSVDSGLGSSFRRTNSRRSRRQSRSAQTPGNQRANKEPDRVDGNADEVNTNDLTLETEASDNLGVILDDLHTELQSVIRAERIDAYQIHHDPKDIYKVVIHGVDMERIQSKLVQPLSVPKYRKFAVSIQNIYREKSRDEGVPSVEDWIVLMKGECGLEGQTGRISQVELILKGVDERKYWEYDTGYYAVTTGHSFTPGNQGRASEGSGSNFRDVWSQAVEADWDSPKFLLSNNGIKVEMTSRPYQYLRYYYPCKLRSQNFFVTDIAVFKVNESQMSQDWLKSSNFELHQQPSKESELSAESNYSNTRTRKVENILQINREQSLQTYTSRKIICANKTGRIAPMTTREDNGMEYGKHISFTMDTDSDKLVAGDCGSLVYLVDDKDSSKLHIFGMFFGYLKHEPLIHQAIVLSWSISQVEKTPIFKLKNLSLFAFQKCQAKYGRREEDSGYKSGRKSASPDQSDKGYDSVRDSTSPNQSGRYSRSAWEIKLPNQVRSTDV